jgi:hypothetical protein
MDGKNKIKDKNILINYKNVSWISLHLLILIKIIAVIIIMLLTKNYKNMPIKIKIAGNRVKVKSVK